MTPPLERLYLPSGRSLLVCADCAHEPPRHAWFCLAVRHYPRIRILQEMMRVEDEIRTLRPQLVEPAPGACVRREFYLLRDEFWLWALHLGVNVFATTKEERLALRAEVNRERRNQLPPWKRRRSA